ncbi:MAG: hypothetical protein RL723_555 [Actinomycetota bacterium]
MNKVSLRAVLFTLLVLVALGSVFSVGPVKQKNLALEVSNSPCVDTGVTLIVDQGGNQDQVLTRCVKYFEGTGWNIFNAANLNVQGTAEYPESFVCRLNDFPSAETEDCLRTPSFAKGTWVYFNATAENTEWMRSGQGAASRNPSCGDYEGWRYITSVDQSNAAPRFEARPFRCQK